MKLHISLLTALASGLAMSTSLKAATLVYEGFEYTAGSNLAGANGGTGFTQAWTANASDFTVNATSLAYTGLATSGGSVSLVGNGVWSTGAKRNYSAINTTTSGVIWGSYLARPDVIGDDGFELKYGEAGAGVNQGNINYGNATGFGNSGGTASKLDTNSNSGTVYGPTLVIGQTHLLVWAFNATASEVNGIFPGDYLLFLDPAVGVDPDAASPSVYKYAGAGPLSTLGITQIFARNTTVTVDEMRIGQSFADVTPGAAIPEPSSLAVGALGVLAAAGIRRRKSGV